MLASLLLLALEGAAMTATGESFIVVPGAPSRVEFQSKAAMETFTGRTHQVSGNVELDPAQLGDVIQVQIEVEMETLDTGIALRNKHMIENHLHTDRFPRAVFTGGKLTDLSHPVLEDGKPVTGILTGELDLHGVKKPLTARFEMVLNGSALRIVAAFAVTLADHDIPRPKFLMMKLGERQTVTVDLLARAR